MWVSDFWESLLVFPVSTLSFDKNASLNFWYTGCLTLSPWFNACKVTFSSLDKLSIKTGLSQLSFITDSDKEFNKMLEEKQIIEQNSLESLDNIDTDTQDEDGAADEQ